MAARVPVGATPVILFSNRSSRSASTSWIARTDTNIGQILVKPGTLAAAPSDLATDGFLVDFSQAWFSYTCEPEVALWAVRVGASDVNVQTLQGGER